MAKVLLAFEDVGMAVQLQEELEGAGHEVRWDGAQARGPADGPVWADAVLITSGSGDVELAETVLAWHDAEPPPALVLMGTAAGDQAAAASARVTYVPSTSTTAAISDAIESAIKVRYAGGLDASSPLKVGLRALGLPVTGSELDLVLALIAGARKADVNMVREALRWHAAEYVTASSQWIATLREQRALTIPEVEYTPILDGTRCLQNALRAGKLEPWQAARFVWAMASAGAVKFTEEPPNQRTSRRRRITQVRYHLRARQAWLHQAETYYDVLELTPAASIKHVEHAVRMLGLRYSPERLDQLDLSNVTPLVKPTWKKILEARSVLADPAHRGRYNQWLAAQSSIKTEWASSQINTASAAEMMARGQKALLAGDLFKAVADMAAACRFHPGHPDYEASLAWARFRAEASREKEDRSVLAGRERAVAEKAQAGRKPWPRALLALGLLCVADDDPDSARWHLQEALACDPNLPAAKQLLARIGRAAS